MGDYIIEKDESELEKEAMLSEYQVEKYLEEERLKDERKPKIIFKYKSLDSGTDVNRICELFERRKIYMPNYIQLNDPLEGMCELLLGKEDLKREELRSSYRILSFSRNCFLPPMWANYAGNYKGICIGFWTANTFQEVQEVEYKKKTDSFTSDLKLSMPEVIYKKSEYL